MGDENEAAVRGSWAVRRTFNPAEHVVKLFVGPRCRHVAGRRVCQDFYPDDTDPAMAKPFYPE